MKLIDVSTKTYPGAFAMVDDEDYEKLSQNKWYAELPGGKTFYAKRSTTRPDGKQKTITMHRVIMGPPPGMLVDHIDGNGLNNQRGNLRICTPAENSRNVVSRIGVSKYKGVSPKTGKWMTTICLNRKKIQIGTFVSEEDAARAYNAAAIKYFGAFAKLNIIPGDPIANS